MIRLLSSQNHLLEEVFELGERYYFCDTKDERPRAPLRALDVPISGTETEIERLYTRFSSERGGFETVGAQNRKANFIYWLARVSTTFDIHPKKNSMLFESDGYAGPRTETETYGKLGSNTCSFDVEWSVRRG
jgi:hypothetical protein